MVEDNEVRADIKQIRQIGTIKFEFLPFARSLPTGLELTFYSGVYGTCIGAMTRFGQDAKSLIGVSGIFIGMGEILGEFASPCCVLLMISAHENTENLEISQGDDVFSFCSPAWPGGGLFGMLNKCNRFGRNPVVLLGLITHFVAFYLIFLNIASDAPLAPEEGTDLQAYINPRYKERRDTDIMNERLEMRSGKTGNVQCLGAL